MPKPRHRITNIEVFNRDVVVSRQGRKIKASQPCRGEIVEFTERARKRLAFIASNTSVVFRTMLTLTYPNEYPSDGKEVKANLKAMLMRITRKVGKENFSYLWFIEFQERGAPHFHVMTNVPLKEIGYKWLSNAWYEVVDSGDKKHLLAGTNIETLRNQDGRYAVKYAYKMRQKQVPVEYQNVGRFYGYSRDVKPRPVAQINQGCIEQIFKGNDTAIEAFNNGYKVIFNASGHVMENLINEKQQ